MQCLKFGDIVGVGQPQIQEMQRIGDAYVSPEDPGACEAFTRQVGIVEGLMVQTYGIAAAMARKSDDLEEVAGIWIEMSRFCQSALARLATLKQKYPYCGTPALYDKVLDYKLACDKRYRGATEELELTRLIGGNHPRAVQNNSRAQKQIPFNSISIAVSGRFKSYFLKTVSRWAHSGFGEG